MQDKEVTFSFKNFFSPLTNLKIIHLLILTGFLVYGNGLGNGFVGDDFDQIVNNTFVQHITNLPYFFLGGTFNNGFTPLSGMYYKPIMTILFSSIYSLFGSGPFFFHLFQLFFHIINSIFCFYLFKRFFSKNMSFWGALLFLIHPINSEAVLYISSLQDVLFTFFGLLALLFLIYKNNTLLTTLLLLCSLLSKETGIMFVFISIIYSVLYIPVSNESTKTHNMKDAISRFTTILKSNSVYLPPVILYIVLRLNAVGIYSYHSELFPFTRLGLTQRLINLPAILFYYLKTFAFPIHLAFDQNWVIRSISLEQFFIPLISVAMVVLFVSLFATKLLRKDDRKTVYFFLMWLLVGLLLHIQIIPLDMTVADRWFYFPGIGLLGILCLALQTNLAKLKTTKSVTAPVTALFLIVLSLLTFIRSFDWRSQYTLYKHDIQYNKDSYTLLNGYGLELMNLGKYDEAKPYIIRSIEFEPDFCYSWNNLGSIAIHDKDYKSARKYYEEAVNRSGCVMAYENLATLLYYHFDLKTAHAFTQKAVNEVPGSSRLYLLLSLEYHKMGEKEKAIKAIKKSLHVKQTPEAVFVYSKLMQDEEFELKEQ